MKNKLNISPAALNDLHEISDYITHDLENQAAAKRVINQILDKIAQLVDFPQMGTNLSSLTEIDSDYRFLLCGHYLAFYRIVEYNIYIDLSLIHS